MSRGNAIMVDLPRDNPFGESQPRSRPGGQSGSRQLVGRNSRRHQSDDDEEFEDQGHDARRTNVTQLPTVNPFARDEPSRSGRPGGQSGTRQGGRRRARAYSDDDMEEGHDGGIIELPHVNPFAPGGNRNPPRIIEPVHPPTEPEPESEEEGEGEEEDYIPPPPPRRAQTLGSARPPVRTSNLDRPLPNERQRTANSRSQRPSADPQEDDRLVISWVDEGLVSPPRSPARRHGHHQSPATSESESYFALQPHRPRSVRSASPRHGRSHSHHPDNHSHHHHGHHSHHDRHCHQCNHLAIPPWQPPFPMPPADWSGYGAPRSPYSPAPPYPYSRPLYANIPDLPSLLDQFRVPYPPVPVPPVAFLRTLQAQAGAGIESPLPVPSSLPANVPMILEEWKNQLTILASPKPELFLAKLKQQAFDPAQIDRVFRKLTNVVQVRFGERQGNEIVNRVHVVPRGRLAMGTVIASDPKIDVDLVIPSDFILRRWNVTAAETDDLRPKTIADALDLNPGSINRGEVENTKLHWVFQAIWEQLNGSADGSIFPGGRDEAEQYLPKNWCTRYKDDVRNLNRLALNTVDVVQVKVNIFVKVSLSLYGQDMIIGVDQSSMRSDQGYQLIKTLRTPGVPLSEPALSPTLQTAILLLCWSQQITEILPGKIRASHFHLALTALRKLEPSDSMFSDGEPFSLYQVLKAVMKILTFLGRAYTYNPPTFGVGYAFPLSSCTLMDTLRLQAVPNIAQQGIVLGCMGLALVPFQLIEKGLQAASGDLGSILGALKSADKDVDGAAEAVTKPLEGSVAAGSSNTQGGARSNYNSKGANSSPSASTPATAQVSNAPASVNGSVTPGKKPGTEGKAAKPSATPKPESMVAPSESGRDGAPTSQVGKRNPNAPSRDRTSR